MMMMATSYFLHYFDLNHFTLSKTICFALALKYVNGSGILNWNYQVRQTFRSVMHQEVARNSVTLSYQQNKSQDGPISEVATIQGVVDNSLQLFALCLSSQCPEMLNVSWSYHISK